MMQQTVRISGMTCQNCVRHVTEALTELEGVRSVDVSLERGEATIDADRSLPLQTIASALDEAGYALA